MSDTKEFDQEKEFDSILAAVSSGDHAELNKLMESEPNTNVVVQETTEEPASTVEDPAPVVQTEVVDTVEPVVDPTTPVVAEVKPEDNKPDIPDDVKAELDRLRQEVHRYKSDAGRVPFTQKRMQEMEREIATLRAAKAAESGTSEGGDVELDADTKAIIDELRVTDPVMAKALEAVAKKAITTATTKVTSAFNEYSKTTQEADDERYFADQYSLLTSQIPQAPQIFASNEWKQWKQTLTPNRRAMAESVHAEEVATAIYAFAADMQRGAVVQTPPVLPPAPAAPAAQEQTEAVQKAIQERARKVTSAAEVSPAAARVAEEFDEEKAYLDMYNKIAKANHIK